MLPGGRGTTSGRNSQIGGSSSNPSSAVNTSSTALDCAKNRVTRYLSRWMEIAHSKGPEKANTSHDMRRKKDGTCAGSSAARPVSAPAGPRVDMEHLDGFTGDAVKHFVRIPNERNDSHASSAVSPLPRSLATLQCGALSLEAAFETPLLCWD